MVTSGHCNDMCSDVGLYSDFYKDQGLLYIILKNLSESSQGYVW